MELGGGAKRMKTMMNNSRWIGTLALCALSMAGRSALADTKIAVVNVPEVSEKYDRTKDLESHFDNVRKSLQQQRDDLKQKVERTTKSLNEDFKPGTEEYRTRRKELAMMEAQLQYFVDSEGKQIEAELAESLRSIFDDIQTVIRAVAEEKGFDLVLVADAMPPGAPDSTQQVRQQIVLQKVLYASPRVDITGEVVTRLNDKYRAAKNK